MSEKNICSKCGKEFDKVFKYQGKQYCHDCYYKKIEGGAINTLDLFAKFSLFGGIIGALIVWFTMGTIRHGYSSEINILLGIVILVNGVFCWAVFQVICSIANNLIAIRKNTSK